MTIVGTDPNTVWDGQQWRRWDGAQWLTLQAATAGPAYYPTPPMRAARRMQPAQWVALGGAGALFIGSLLPWVTGPFGISINGTSGDGVLSIILSIPLAVFGWLLGTRRWASVVNTIVASLAVALMVYEVVHITSVQFAGLGIGVIVCLVGALAGVVGSVLGWRARSEFRGSPQ